LKGELEHRTPKARYKRTSRKFFSAQMAKIERREARIRRIRERLGCGTPKNFRDNGLACTPHLSYQIGKNQNNPEHIQDFLRRNSGDPAVKVTERMFWSR
jgi:hypothetical protein